MFSQQYSIHKNSTLAIPISLVLVAEAKGWRTA